MRTIAEIQNMKETQDPHTPLKEVRGAIDTHESDVHAYLEVFDDAEEQVEAVVQAGSSGATHPLAGIPVAIKDNIVMEGRTTSAASAMLASYTGTYDAEVVRRLKDAGAVIMGRTNMDEFAMGSSTENSAFGVTRNPRDRSRVPGGSSGGSAAAVAYGGAIAAIGSDTGGSIRQPASFCGVVGLKPTYGAVSRSGLIAMASSLDQIGPITRSVADAETLFHVLRGEDRHDSTSAPDVYWEGGSDSSVHTIGVPYALLDAEGVDPAVKENVTNTVASLEKKGYTCREVSLSELSYALAAYYVLMPAEVSSNLARFDGIRYGATTKGDTLFDDYALTRADGLGAEVRRRILLGTYVLSSGYYDAYYKNAAQVRDRIRHAFTRVFADVDALMLPTTPTPAFPIGEKTDDPLAMYMTDFFTVPANLAGVPALSVPSGTVERDGTDLPLGIQLIAPAFAEDRLFAVGRDIENERDMAR